MKRRLMITIDYEAGRQPYVLSALPQIDGLVHDVLLRRSGEPDSRRLSIPYLDVEVTDGRQV